MIRFAVLALLASGLAACNGDAPSENTTGEARRGAKGEVLGGTISDDMLPLDTLRSRSPPLEEPSRSGRGATSGTSRPAATEPSEAAENGEDADPEPVEAETED